MKNANLVLVLLLLFSALLSSFYSTPSFAQTCQEMVGQMIITDPPPEPHPWVGGVILFEENLKGTNDAEDILALSQKYSKPNGSNIPRLVSFDQEGGLVQRLNEKRGFKDIPTSKEIFAIGQSENGADQAGYWGGVAGYQVNSVGGNMNFSTVVDTCEAGNPIIDKYGRCFSSKPDEIAAYGERHALANMYYDVIPTLKHFPGHGASDGDSHLGFVDVPSLSEAQLRAQTQTIYGGILNQITENDIEQQTERNKTRTADGEETVPVVTRYPAVMVGHLNFSQFQPKGTLPASLNRDMVTGLLRGELGHKGLIITDDIGAMKAVRDLFPFDREKYTSSVEEATILAIKAGNDLVIIKNDKVGDQPEAFPNTQAQANMIQSICRKSQEDTLLAQEIADSYKRILQNKRDYHMGGQIDPNIDQLSEAELLAAVSDLRAGDPNAPVPLTPSLEMQRQRQQNTPTTD